MAPEADLHLLRELESAPIGWVRRHVNEAAPVRTFDETELVNATVSAPA